MGGGEWNSLLEAMGRTEKYTLSVQLSDKLMTFNQDYFFSGGGKLFILPWMGKRESFPLCSGCF